MSRRRARERRRGDAGRPEPRTGPDRRLRLEPIHGLLVAGGVAVAVAGFWFLSRGSISLAPALLIAAYLVLLPVGLVLPARRRHTREDPPDRR